MRKTNTKQFDYQKIAKLDTNMWRAYYNHQFFKLFWQLVQLTRSQIRPHWFTTLRLAYYAGWAAADYRIHKGGVVNNDRIRRNLVQFYRIISAHAAEPFDYQKAGELELIWWDVHRQSYKNNPALEKSLAEAAAVIYNVPPSALREYAHYRAEAMILPRHVGDDKHKTDWAKVHKMLVTAWKSLYDEVNR